MNTEEKKCCDKCYDIHTEHTWPAHTVHDACVNQGCECHQSKPRTYDEMNIMQKEGMRDETISNFVRDVTKVGGMAKSEVRRRLNDLLSLQTKCCMDGCGNANCEHCKK